MAIWLPISNHRGHVAKLNGHSTQLNPSMRFILWWFKLLSSPMTTACTDTVLDKPLCYMHHAVSPDHHEVSHQPHLRQDIASRESAHQTLLSLVNAMWTAGTWDHPLWPETQTYHV